MVLFHKQIYHLDFIDISTNIDERRRIPLHIQSPSLSRINPFIDHASLTTNEHANKKTRTNLPKVTRLQNGDVIISA